MSFIIHALPRSRTYWLSRFLTYGDWTCHHDELRHIRSMDDVKSWFAQPLVGTVETAAMPWWRLVPKDVRTVVIRRPVAEVVASLMRLAPYDEARLTALMVKLDHKLDQIEARVPGTLSVRFSDLAKEETCAEVFRFCLPYGYDDRWWRDVSAINLQVNLPALMRYHAAHAGQMAKIAAVARFESIRAMRKPIGYVDGMTIQREPLATFLRDGTALFDRHLTDVGEAPGTWMLKNLPLMRAFEDHNSLVIMTARSNGRMFGYLMAVIAPSLESEHLTSALHTTFYVSPDAPGLGLKLQRASVEVLRDLGVDEIFLRSGVRGSGARLGTLYRRMGAEPFGDLYRLKLAA